MVKNSTLLSNTPSFHPIGQPFIVLPTVDSTNNYAMAQARKGLTTHGSVFLAREQTSGKGQRGKKWLANPDENIMLSAVLNPAGISINEQFLLSASMALACYDFYKIYGGPDTTRIKWPNDLYWQDRKAGGILIESVVGSSESKVRSQEPGVRSRATDTRTPKQGFIGNKLFNTNGNMEEARGSWLKASHWLWAIVGIGININQTTFSKDLRNPVSLKQITGKTHDPVELALELCNCMQTRYASLLTNTAPEILKEYSAVLYKLNQPVKLKKENAIFETTIQGVSLDGKLLTKDVLARSFDFGEVEWV